jgi:hypothetical protein
LEGKMDANRPSHEFSSQLGLWQSQVRIFLARNVERSRSITHRCETDMDDVGGVMAVSSSPSKPVSDATPQPCIDTQHPERLFSRHGIPVSLPLSRCWWGSVPTPTDPRFSTLTNSLPPLSMLSPVWMLHAASCTPAHHLLTILGSHSRH